VKPVKPNIGLK